MLANEFERLTRPRLARVKLPSFLKLPVLAAAKSTAPPVSSDAERARRGFFELEPSPGTDHVLRSASERRTKAFEARRFGLPGV